MEDFEFVFEYKDNSDDVNEQITQYANLWLKNNLKTENICNLVTIFGNGVESLN